MRLFHVSEESDIQTFIPRTPTRDDLDKTIGLVWALDEKRLPNFLTPRDCPRVTYHIGEQTTEDDIKKYFSSSTISHSVVIEHKWFNIMKSTTLYIYEFDDSGFSLQDNIAGYYIAKTEQKPITKHIVKDLFSELINRNVEIRVVDNLWDICEEIKQSSLNWSMCRMGNAQPK